MRLERSSPRFRVSLRGRLSLKNSPSNYPAFVKDISLKGAKLSLDNSIKVFLKDKLYLYLSLPEEALLSAEVVWIRQYSERKDIGVAFNELLPFQKEKIRLYIEKNFSHIQIS